MMSQNNRFIVSHQIKWSWKFLKHGIGVLLMVNDRESAQSHGLSKPGKDRQIFMDYLESTREF